MKICRIFFRYFFKNNRDFWPLPSAGAFVHGLRRKFRPRRGRRAPESAKRGGRFVTKFRSARENFPLSCHSEARSAEARQVGFSIIRSECSVALLRFFRLWPPEFLCRRSADRQAGRSLRPAEARNCRRGHSAVFSPHFRHKIDSSLCSEWQLAANVWLCKSRCEL